MAPSSERSASALIPTIIHQTRTDPHPSTNLTVGHIPRQSSTDTEHFAAPGSSDDTMHYTVSAPSSKRLKFTKTGRVSKATKGERVHACDQCRKVYTRAEHLRRHKKNHSNTASLQCDAPGCGRYFYREDLLLRHKQRHNDPSATSWRDSSVESQLPAGVYSRATTPSHYRHGSLGSDVNSAALRAVGVATRRTSQVSTSSQIRNSVGLYGTMSANDLNHGVPLNTKSSNAYVTPDHVSQQTQMRTSTTGYEPEQPLGYRLQPPPTSPSHSYASPNFSVPYSQPYYQVQEPSHWQMLDAVYDQSLSYLSSKRSSISLDSTWPVTTAEDNWGANFASMGTPSSDYSHEPYTNSQAVVPHHELTQFGSFVLPGPDAEQRDFMELSDLQISAAGTSSVFDPSLGLDASEDEQRHIGAYWQAIHPVWPIVHRGTFAMHQTNPLLRAAMIALGAQSTGNSTDISYARVLHERCLKVLRKRTNESSHTFRIADMQAIVLVELFALFKSRRPPLQVSQCFEDVYRTLAGNEEAWSSTLSMLSHLSVSFNAQATNELQQESKQRLLIACYILDHQQALFFGRQLSVCLDVYNRELSGPRTSTTWDAAPIDPGVMTLNNEVLLPYSQAYEVADAATTTGTGISSRQEVFSSMYAITRFTNTVTSQLPYTLRSFDEAAAAKLSSTIENAPRTQLSYHLSLLCSLTPVRQLLAVAGESWVMAEKITSQAEYHAAQSTIREWTSERSTHPPSAHISALSHALCILDIHRQAPRTGLVTQEWAVYLASLVVWISAYTVRDTPPRAKIDDAALPLAVQELDRTIVTLAQAESSQQVSWRDASCVLLWTKSRLSQVGVPHSCGLINGALDIVGKLISRGHEETWIC